MRAHQRTRPVIAIDGPAGAGKSTVAAHLARTFGYLNLETGAMYRAFALKALNDAVDLEDEKRLLELATDTSIMLESTSDGNRVLLDGQNVSQKVRESDVTAAASRISIHAQIRSWMVDQQRELGATGGVVMEGRDIGTVVFPDAEIKIFLDAASEVRGNRRYLQAAPGNAGVRPLTEAEVVAELTERDERDRNRIESPLRPAKDAIVVDSSSMTLAEVLCRVEQVVEHYLAQR